MKTMLQVPDLTLMNNYQLKVVLNNDVVSIFIKDDPNNMLSLWDYERGYFNSPSVNAQTESLKLQKKFYEMTGEEKDLVEFVVIVDSIVEKCLLVKIEKSKLDNERLQSLLIYHAKTLRSIRKNYNISLEVGINYLDMELYNISNVKIEDLLSILDTITAKRKK